MNRFKNIPENLRHFVFRTVHLSNSQRNDFHAIEVVVDTAKMLCSQLGYTIGRRGIRRSLFVDCAVDMPVNGFRGKIHELFNACQPHRFKQVNGAIDVRRHCCDREIDGQVRMGHRRRMNNAVNAELLDRADNPRNIEQLTLYSRHELRASFGVVAIVANDLHALFAQGFRQVPAYIAQTTGNHYSAHALSLLLLIASETFGESGEIRWPYHHSG
ncbi:hypothetical protein D3C81_1386030 [compost metagenome]